MPMPTRPPAMLPLRASCAPPVSRRVWQHARILVVGTLLAPGRRTGAAAWRAMGRDQHQQHTLSCTSAPAADMVELPRTVTERLTDALCYPA